jgi:NADH:ubiquinone oxidoreductase subunit F (NADH-binding)
MAARPHLVLDGVLLAADAVGAGRALVYVGREHHAARAALQRAAAERASELGRLVTIVEAPTGYVAGEETAAVRYVNEGVALPTSTPPRPFERGVGGRATLVQNVESLAAAALVARLGDGWYRSAGRDKTPGSALVTVSGSTARPGVQEIELGTTVGEAATAAGGLVSPSQAVLLGGYFGAWASTQEAWQLPLDPARMRSAGLSFGCGVVFFLPPHLCGVEASARIVSSMAAASAGQCGPCLFGLAAIAEAAGRLARGAPQPDDLQRLARWCDQLPGRGACRLPDGAAGFMRSALRVFAGEFSLHQHHGQCSQPSPLPGEGWVGTVRGRAA